MIGSEEERGWMGSESSSLLVPLQILGVAELSRGNLVLDGEDDALKEADGAHDDVRVAEERVLSADPGGGGEDEALLSVEGGHGVIVPDSGGVVAAGGKIVVDDAIQLLEVRKTSSPHPHDEVLVLKIRNGSDALSAGRRVLELVGPVGRPRDSILPQRNRASRRSEQSERIIEETSGDEAAGEVEVGHCLGISRRDVWIAVRKGGVARDHRTLELRVVSGLHVSSVVLIEVLQAVI